MLRYGGSEHDLGACTHEFGQCFVNTSPAWPPPLEWIRLTFVWRKTSVVWLTVRLNTKRRTRKKWNVGPKRQQGSGTSQPSQQNQSIPVAFATQRKTFQFFVLAILRLSPRVYFARPVASPAGLSPPSWPSSVSSIDWYITIAQRRSQCWWPTSVQCIRLRRLRYWQSRGQWGRPGGSIVTANISTSMRIKRMEKAWEESAVVEDGLHSDQTRQIKQYALPPPPGETLGTRLVSHED